jgi:hypothetical protein
VAVAQRFAHGHIAVAVHLNGDGMVRCQSDIV